ncbi:Uncharacterised protein [uncultured Eubacterium sp.]|nr:Uncharacterised protein [uncultured Eubacterium sp.]
MQRPPWILTGSLEKQQKNGENSAVLLSSLTFHVTSEDQHLCLDRIKAYRCLAKGSLAKIQALISLHKFQYIFL